MSNVKKLMMSAAGGGDVTNVEDVFSTTLYTANNTAQGVNTGVPLADGPLLGSSTYFDGSNSGIQKTSDLSGNTNGKTCTISFWAWVDGGDLRNRKIYHTSGTWKNEVTISSSGSLTVAFYNNESSGGTVFEIQNPSIGLAFNTWNHVVFSFDLTDTNKRHLYINDESPSSVSWTYVNNTIDFTRTTHAIGDDLTSTTGSMHGYIAHFFLDYTYRDLSNTSTRRNFIDASGGSTSPSTLSALNPIIYLPMTEDYTIGENEGTGGDFSANGSPRIVTYNGTEAQSGVTDGGLVWIKNRTNGSTNHYLVDTDRGALNYLSSNLTNPELDASTGLYKFHANGFEVNGVGAIFNSNGNDYAAWSFRKFPGFFDIITYTGDGVNGRSISHNLGTDVGFMMVKCLSSTTAWAGWHRSQLNSSAYLRIDSTTLENSFSLWNNTTPTSTHFTVGDNATVNGSGKTYVAYLFAHNDSNGSFGETFDQDIIKCGSYTGNGVGTGGPLVDLGFEPQWLLIANTSASQYYSIYDTKRGLPLGQADARLHPNRGDDDSEAFGDLVRLRADGFQASTSSNQINQSGNNYVYVAIRKPMRSFTDAEDVFAFEDLGEYEPRPPGYKTTSGYANSVNGFPVDMGIQVPYGTSSSKAVSSRKMHGANLILNANSTRTLNSQWTFDFEQGWRDTTTTSTDYMAWMWRRAPGYFDVASYLGGGNVTGTNLKPHNLGVKPEMIWIKNRESAQDWIVWHKDMNYNTGESYTNKAFMKLNKTFAATLSSNYWSYNGNPQMTDTHFSVGSTYGEVNADNFLYEAYLFASLDGVSKLGGFSGNGTSQTIDCGFTSGARFILVKASSSITSHWIAWDTKRGIVTGNDPFTLLNLTNSQYTTFDIVDPHNSGFTINYNSTWNMNVSGEHYIYYAIA